MVPYHWPFHKSAGLTLKSKVKNVKSVRADLDESPDKCARCVNLTGRRPFSANIRSEAYSR